MVVELTAVLLNQLLSGRKSVLDAYGVIVYKAWRVATGACLERIENHLIQDVSVLCPLHLIVIKAPSCSTTRAASAKTRHCAASTGGVLKCPVGCCQHVMQNKRRLLLLEPVSVRT